MLYMVTFTINIPQMLAYIPYMDCFHMILKVAPPSWFSWFIQPIASPPGQIGTRNGTHGTWD